MRITAILIMALIAFPALAQQKDLQSGMNQIIVRKDTKPASTENTEPLRSEKDQAIWDKYKAIASGTYNQPETEPEQPQQPETPKIERPEKPSGIAGILHNYHANKDAQKDLKTLRFETPDIKTLKNDE